MWRFCCKIYMIDLPLHSLHYYCTKQHQSIWQMFPLLPADTVKPSRTIIFKTPTCTCSQKWMKQKMLFSSFSFNLLNLPHPHTQMSFPTCLLPSHTVLHYLSTTLLFKTILSRVLNNHFVMKLYDLNKPSICSSSLTIRIHTPSTCNTASAAPSLGYWNSTTCQCSCPETPRHYTSTHVKQHMFLTTTTLPNHHHQSAIPGPTIPLPFFHSP